MHVLWYIVCFHQLVVSMAATAPTIVLNTGYEMPVLGLGTYNNMKRGEVILAVKAAIEYGYRLFDTAWIYQLEDEVGDAISDAIQSGIVKREDLFITTKLWSNCHQPERVEACLRDSLRKLKLDHVDLYLMHWPMAFKEPEDSCSWTPTIQPVDPDHNDTFRAMGNLVDKGLARSIGVSNFNIKQLKRLLSADNLKYKPANVQIEIHPYLNNAELINFCREHDISVTAYTPLAKGREMYNGEVTLQLLKEPIVLDLSKKYKKTPAQRGEMIHAVKAAIEYGYCLIDTAWIYQSEDEVGDAISDAIQRGIVKREDLFITSKLWNTFHEPERVEVCLRDSLRQLKLDYVDLYLMHWPMAFKESEASCSRTTTIQPGDTDYIDTFRAMGNLVDKDLVRSIGVSNFNINQLKRLLSTDNLKYKPANVQIEIHPYFNNSELINFCRKHDIAVTAYSPLAKGGQVFAGKVTPQLLKDPVILDLAKKYNKTPAQIVLRWGIQRGYSLITKSVTPQRIQENIQVFNFELASEDMKSISSLNKDYRVVCPDTFKDFPEYPFK